MSVQENDVVDEHGETQEKSELNQMEEEDSEDDSSDGDDVLFQRPPARGGSHNKRPLKPADDLYWKEDAILECFELALHTYQPAATPAVPVGSDPSSSKWQAPPFFHNATPTDESLADWKPASLYLPLWSVASDPTLK